MGFTWNCGSANIRWRPRFCNFNGHPAWIWCWWIWSHTYKNFPSFLLGLIFSIIKIDHTLKKSLNDFSGSSPGSLDGKSGLIRNWTIPISPASVSHHLSPCLLHFSHSEFCLVLRICCTFFHCFVNVTLSSLKWFPLSTVFSWLPCADEMPPLLGKTCHSFLRKCPFSVCSWLSPCPPLRALIATAVVTLHSWCDPPEPEPLLAGIMYSFPPSRELGWGTRTISGGQRWAWRAAGQGELNMTEITGNCCSSH